MPGSILEAMQGVSLAGGKGLVRLRVPNDPEKTARALDEAAIVFIQREVLIVKVLDEPGMLGDVALVSGAGGNRHRRGVQ